MALSVFRRLHEVREFEKQHLTFIRRIEDRDLIWEIGYHQAIGQPLALKQALLLGTGTPSTMLRRLRRLIRLRAVQGHRSGPDRRVVKLTLPPRILRVFGRYADYLAADRAGNCPSKVDANFVCQEFLTPTTIRPGKRLGGV